MSLQQFLQQQLTGTGSGTRQSNNNHNDSESVDEDKGLESPTGATVRVIKALRRGDHKPIKRLVNRTADHDNPINL